MMKKAIPTAPSWHSLIPENIFRLVNSDENGLSETEAQQRLKKFGPNVLPKKHKVPGILRFLNQFNNILIYVLLASALGTAFLNRWTDASVILAVVIINAIIGFIQEGKAETALDAIQNMLAPNATVLRNGSKFKIPAEKLVFGDVVELQVGDKVSADLYLFSLYSLKIDESMLTGESESVLKRFGKLAKATPLAERTNMAFCGTLVTHGHGFGVVIATGLQTEIGKLSSQLKALPEKQTPLLKKINQFSIWLTISIVILAFASFMVGVYIQHYPMFEMYLAAISLAVAAIPEGLPPIITIAMAIGVKKMARLNTIIRKLPAVETIGSVSVICTDKTGTLTHNEMTVQQICVNHHLFIVTGQGYSPLGEILYQQNKILPTEFPALINLIEAGVLCNLAKIEEKEGKWNLHGEPTDGALYTLALKAHVSIHDLKETHPTLQILPFTSANQYMACLHSEINTPHKSSIIVKGAPEKLFSMCSMPFEEQAKWNKIIEKMAQSGLRVLALASRTLNHIPLTLQEEDLFSPQNPLTLLGLVGLSDPPRDSAIDAIEQCKKAGILVKMITGDHVATAMFVARATKLSKDPHVLTGNELDSLSELELQSVIDKIDVFARTSPDQKLRIVQALQANQHIVAMTGDGVNDAPALKCANIGMAMGKKGTEVAKDSAVLVLLDDDFSSIAKAIEMGRCVYDNIQKSLLFILPTSIGEALVVVAAILMGYELPITPLQILWVNMVTTITLALPLAFEPPEKRVMEQKPSRYTRPLFSAFLVHRIILVSILIIAFIFIIYSNYQLAGQSIEYSRTIAVNTLVLFQVVYLWNTRFRTEHSNSLKGFIENKVLFYGITGVIGLQLLFTYFPLFQELFKTNSISLIDWGWMCALAIVFYLLIEFEKYLFRKFS